MADALEGSYDYSDQNEADRCIDRASFTRQQFDIFKHNYRESAAQQQEGLLQSGFEKGFMQVRDAARRLGRVRGGLVALEKEDPTAEAMLIDVTAVLKQLDGFASEATTRQPEFSPTTAHLPPFDSTEMQLFLGSDSPPTSTDSSLLPDSHATATLCKEHLEKLLVNVDALINRFATLLHEHRLCDAFLYD